MKCPRCGSERLLGVGGGRYICRDCGWLSWESRSMESLSLERLKELREKTERRIKRLKKQLKILKRTRRWLDEYIAKREAREEFILELVGIKRGSNGRSDSGSDKGADKGLGIREGAMREEIERIGGDDRDFEELFERKRYGMRIGLAPWAVKKEGKFLVMRLDLLKMIVDELYRSARNFGLEDVETMIAEDSITIIGYKTLKAGEETETVRW